MVEVSASVLNVDNEKAIKTLYELETAKVDYFHIHCNPIVNGTQMPDGCELILDCDFKDVYSYMRIIDDHKYLVAVYDHCNDIIDITNAQGKSLKQIVSE